MYSKLHTKNVKFSFGGIFLIYQKPKFSPLLSSWNPDKYPYYLISVLSLNNDTKIDSYFFDRRNDTDEILFISKGSVTVSYFNYERKKSDSFSAQKNDLIFSRGGTYCELSNPSEDLEFTAIRFFLYTCDTLFSQSQALDFRDIVSAEINHSRVFIDAPLLTHLEDNKKFQNLILELLNEYKTQFPGYQMQIQSLISQMLLILLRTNSLEFDNILCNANMIGISSKYSSNTLMPKDCVLKISDIEILPKKPSLERKNHSLSLFTVKKHSILPEFIENISCEYSIDNITQQNIITISAKNDSNYHIWVYPESEKFTRDLRPHKNTAYIRFFAKCNIAMTFGIVIYNHDIHRCINHTFYIDPSDEYTEFCVPLLKIEDEKKLSPYIYDILNFIENNYQTKIKLEELSEHIHLNPSYLSKVFKEQMGISISDYILKRRLNAATLLLKKDNKPISDIAMETGFYDTAHFAKAFKSVYGITALQYRNNGK